jgi:hypothetical protein
MVGSVRDVIASELKGCIKLVNNLVCDLCDKPEVTINDVIDVLYWYALFAVLQIIAIYGIYQFIINMNPSNMTALIFIGGIVGVVCECICVLFYVMFFQCVHAKFVHSVGRITIAKRR